MKSNCKKWINELLDELLNGDNSTPKSNWYRYRTQFATQKQTSNPNVRVTYENSQVKVSVTNPYYQFSYSDPYVSINIGESKSPNAEN